MKNKDPFAIQFNNPQGDKLIGGYFPRYITDHLHVLALYESVSMSSLLRKIIDNYIMLEEEGHEEYCVHALAKRAYTEWVRRKQYYKEKNKQGWADSRLENRYSEYRKELEQKLLKRGLSDYKTEEILLQMDLMRSKQEGGIL